MLRERKQARGVEKRKERKEERERNIDGREKALIYTPGPGSTSAWSRD